MKNLIGLSIVILMSSCVASDSNEHTHDDYTHSHEDIIVIEEKLEEEPVEVSTPINEAMKDLQNKKK